MAGGRSTINTVLKWGDTASNLTRVIPITSYPALGGTPEKITTTDLEDTMETSVPGVQSVDNMEFGSNYQKDHYEAAEADAGKQLFYELWMGDLGVDGIFAWKGEHSVRPDGGNVNEARKMTTTVFPSTEIKLKTS